MDVMKTYLKVRDALLEANANMEAIAMQDLLESHNDLLVALEGLLMHATHPDYDDCPTDAAVNAAQTAIANAKKVKGE